MPKFCAAWIFGMAHTISRAPHHHQCLLYCSSFPICCTPIHMFMLFCTCVAALHRHPKVNFIHYTAFKWFHLDTNKSLWIFFQNLFLWTNPKSMKVLIETCVRSCSCYKLRTRTQISLAKSGHIWEVKKFQLVLTIMGCLRVPPLF